MSQHSAVMLLVVPGGHGGQYSTVQCSTEGESLCRQKGPVAVCFFNTRQHHTALPHHAQAGYIVPPHTPPHPPKVCTFAWWLARVPQYKLLVITDRAKDVCVMLVPCDVLNHAHVLHIRGLGLEALMGWCDEGEG